MHIANSSRNLLCRLVHCCYCVRVNRTGNLRTGVIFKRVRVTIFAVKKQEVLHILSVCVALFIKHPKRMRRSLLYHILAHFLVNGTNFGKETGHKMCFDYIQFYPTHLLLSEGFGKILSQMCTRLHVKCPLLLSRLNETRIFSTDPRKILVYQIW